MWVTAWLGAALVLAFPLLTRLFGRLAELRFGADSNAARASANDTLTLFFYFAQLPLLVWTLPVFACDNIQRAPLAPLGDWVVSADPSVACGSATHLALALPVVPAILMLVFFVPYYFWRRCDACVVYPESRPHAHERYLRWRECEWELGLSREWRDSQVWLIASFRRPFLGPYQLALRSIAASALSVVCVYARYGVLAQTSIFALYPIFSIIR